MRSSVVALAIAVLVVVGATGLLTGADPEDTSGAALLDTGAVSFDATILSFDATPIIVTVYRPANADAADPVPLVLHSHGWSGKRTTDGTGLVGRLWTDGFGVMSIDARGHGASGGYATVHHKDTEVKDFQAILDWAYDNLDWVEKEPGSGIPKDIVAGGAGYSYAGGLQLMTASYDARLDAIAPEITWNSLPNSLAPNGVPKSVWLDFLYGTAKQSGTRIDPRIDDWYQEMLLTNAMPQDAYEHFLGSSVVASEIRADTLLIQGIPDTLFPLNEAIATYDAIEANGHGADVRLFTHLTGHVAPYAQPFGTTFDRRQIFAQAGPCGILNDVIAGWLDETLRNGPPSAIPEVSFAMEDGSCLRLDALPTTTLERTIGATLAPNAAGTLLIPLAEGPLTLAGVGHLHATPDPLTTGGVGFASLVILSPSGHQRIVDDQSTAFRATPGAPLDIDLAGVATDLRAGDQLFLRLDGLNEWYPHNGARLPGVTLLHDLEVTLPTVE